MSIPAVPTRLRNYSGSWPTLVYNYLIALVAALQASFTGWIQGGNSFGAQGVFGTLDMNGILFKSAGNGFLTVDASGNATFGSSVANAATIVSAPAATIGAGTGSVYILGGGVVTPTVASRNNVVIDTTDQVAIGGADAASIILGKIGGSIGFLGATPGVRPNITGSKGGNTALASLITALATLGLVTDGTS